MGRLIPAGTGFSYHQQRRAVAGKSVEEKEIEEKRVTASEAEQALSEALKSSAPQEAKAAQKDE